MSFLMESNDPRMTRNQTLIVNEQPSEPLRLDKFLMRHVIAPSRSVLQKWIHEGYVQVNGRKVSKHHFLSQGDIITLTLPDEHHETSARGDLSLSFLFEDEHILVVDKPAGLLVHPTTAHDTTPTLVDVLRTRIPHIDTVGDDPLRPGIVHRLDRDVSGVMIIAKTQESFEQLQQQFHDRRVTKEYRAIVHGIPSQEHFVLTFRIAHSKRNGGKMAARPEHAEGKDAWTECDIVETLHQRYALLAIHIRTGRTHQIRAHLAAIDHPIVGDTRYTSQRYRSHRTYARLFLHAFRLVLTHPVTGKTMTWTAPLPSEFFQFIPLR